jgi:hypothetical protein
MSVGLRTDEEKVQPERIGRKTDARNRKTKVPKRIGRKTDAGSEKGRKQTLRKFLDRCAWAEQGPDPNSKRQALSQKPLLE